MQVLIRQLVAGATWLDVLRSARLQDVDPVQISRIRTGSRSLVRTLGAVALPSVAPVVLSASALAWAEPLSTAYFILGTMAFFILYTERCATNAAGIDLVRRVFLPWTATLLILGILGTVTETTALFSPPVLMTWAVFTPLLQSMLSYYMPKVIALLVRFRRDKHRVVVVGANELGLSFARALNADEIAHSRVVAFFDDRCLPRLGTVDAPYVGPRAELPEYTRRERVDQIYIALPLSSQPRIVSLLEDLRDCTASTYFVPDLLSTDPIQPRLDTHAGFPVVSVCESPFHGIDGAMKRAFDLLVASVAVVALAPVLAVIAIAVKTSSPGPVLSRQRRYGLDSKEIMVWKFRSMTVTEDGASSCGQVVRDDAQLTRIGKFLRSTSLDELPQLFNVLQGAMSIVGPRPHAMVVNERYRRQIPGYMVRHKVRPGITGWAQVHGYYGGDDLYSMSKRIEYDLAYLRQWSIWMDLRILLRTIRLVVKDRRAPSERRVQADA